MKRRLVAATISLVAIILVSIFAASQWLGAKPEPSEFYVGVEVAYANATARDVEVMVDKVKDYTNLVVIGSPQISLNETALNETCNYIKNAGLNFIVLFTDSTMYTTFNPFAWMAEAPQKYGDQFLGIYRLDEPGGNQLDSGRVQMVPNATSYSEAAKNYTGHLGFIVNYYLNYTRQVFTADYALQWFDYESNYSAVFTEFASNDSKEIAVAECRGAATNFGRDWGMIVGWKYDAQPYIESGTELLDDLMTAYKAGAKYAIVFDYPQLGTYGTLQDEHFDALQQFWDYVHDNPQDFGSQKPKVAYVLPEYYGFGLRRANDRIWGLFPADALSTKVWGDVNKLVTTYGFNFDIIYDEPGVVDAVRSRYQRLIFWNETVT